MRQIIVVAGPTAVGKTKYAIAIAKAVGGEIVSCDSMQLYKYMNISGAKPTAERQEVKHYLVDQIDPRAFLGREIPSACKTGDRRDFPKWESACHQRRHWALPQRAAL